MVVAVQSTVPATLAHVRLDIQALTAKQHHVLPIHVKMEVHAPSTDPATLAHVQLEFRGQIVK